MKKLTAVGCYVYAGGFSIGVRAAGFDVLAHNEDPKPYGGSIIEENRKLYWNTLSVCPYPNWYQPTTPVNLVHANPPCAIFSPAGGIGRRDDDPRRSCWPNVVEYVTSTRPDAFVGESVVEMYTRGRDILNDVVSKLIGAGYRVYVVLHNACHCGSAQFRPRLFVVASHYRVDFTYPKVPSVTVGDVLKLVRPEPGDPEIRRLVNPQRQLVLDAMQPGETSILVHRRLGMSSNPLFGAYRPRWEGQVPVCVGGGVAYTPHPTESRLLTYRELVVLRDFPPDYILPTNTSVTDYLNRGVSPKVGSWIAGAIDKSLTTKLVEDNSVAVIDANHPKLKIVSVTDLNWPNIYVSRKFK